jgi:hypothetical protein
VDGVIPATDSKGNGEGSFLTPATTFSPHAVTFYEDNNPHDHVLDPNGAHVSTTFTCNTTKEQRGDITPPIIIISQDIVERATGPNGTTISFEVSAEDDSDGGAVPVNCDHNPGKTFPIGETIVRCTAEDSLGNGAEEYFNIAVQDAGTPEIKK